MKKITLFIAFIAFAFFANAQVIYDETFTAFPASTDVTGIPTNGWLNWASNIGPAAGDVRTVNSSALAYSDAGGLTALSGLGNSLWNDYTGVSGNNYITYKEFSSTPVETGSIYMSYLFQAIKQGGSQGEVLGITDSIHRGAMRTWIGKGNDATTYKLGLVRSSGSSADIQYIAGKSYTYGTIYFIVLKYEFATGKASLYINPGVGTTTEATAEVIDDTKGTARTSMRYLMVRNGGSNKAYYNASSVRICSSWTDAVAAFKTSLPKIGTPTIGAAQAVDTESFTANWTPVSDAIGYTVYVYNGAVMCNKVEVDGQAKTNALIEGLVSNTDYTYKVQAKGDNVSKASSELSSVSSVFKTADGRLSLNPDFSDGNWGTVYESSIDEPATGSFPTFFNNGFSVIKGLCSHSNKTGPNAEVHTHSIKLDKGSTGAMIILPSMKSVSRVEIHAWTGTALRPFMLQELLNDGTWSTGELFTTNDIANADNIFVSTLTRSIGTKLRIINTGGGALNIGQILVESSPNAVNTPTVSNLIRANGKTIVVPELGNIDVFNLQGALVNQAKNVNQLSTNLKTGLYIVKFTNHAGQVFTNKLIFK